MTTVLEPAGGETGMRAQHGPHVDALDGLRGVAVAAVVVFHAAPSGWLPGGFLGVSLFFTLSGYLITSLALGEVARTGRLAIGEFYARRVRRLVPALVMLMIGVVVVGRVVTLAARTRSQIPGGLFYYSNWLQILDHTSYAELWSGRPGVLDHLWSLAIEEQWYLLFPVIVGVLVRRWGAVRLRRSLAWTFAAAIAVSVVSAIIASDENLIYLGTHTRLGEIAVGGLLALAVPLGSARPAPGAVRLGGFALVATVVSFRFTSLSSGWLYAGLLPAYALVSALVINGAIRPGRLADRLSWRPWRRLGQISYGLYLYHWPIAVVLAPPRVTWHPVVLFVVRTAVALVAAELSYRWLEMPLRNHRLPARFTLAGGVGTLCAATAACVSIAVLPTVSTPASAGPVLRQLGGAVPVAAHPVGADPAADASEPGPPGAEPDHPTSAGDETPATSPAVASQSAAAAPQPVAIPSTAAGSSAESPVHETRVSRAGSGIAAAAAPASAPSSHIIVFGDSVADWLLRDGESAGVPAGWSVTDAAVEGCDGAPGMPEGRGANNVTLPVPDDCPNWPDWYDEAFGAVGEQRVQAGREVRGASPGSTAGDDPDAVDPADRPIAVLVPGQAIVVDRALDGDWSGPCSPKLASWYTADFDARLDALDTLARRTFVVLPAWSTDKSIWIYPADHVERVTCVRTILQQAATAHPGVSIVDLAELVCPEGPGQCRDLRVHDGVHFDPAAAPEVLSWLLATVTAPPPAATSGPTPT